jgi:LacI family transcriptional regulator
VSSGSNVRNENGHATMADVALRAGVSLKSVSRVVNDEAHVSDRLRLKVEAAIVELDYVPDTAARSLAGSRSFEIGLILGEMGPSYNAKVVTGVYRACIEHHYHLRLDAIPHYAGEQEVGKLVERILRNSRCDGFVIVPPYCDMQAMLDLLDARQIRYSLIGPAQDLGRAPGVTMDDTAAAREVAELFWRHGHRRIGLVNGLRLHVAALRRREGFLARLREFDPAIEVTEAEGGFLFEQGIEAGLELLRRDNRPTAIFAVNDDSAAGVLSACHQLGLDVPRDVSICGFDDSWVAKSVWPYLTTIAQPTEAMAYSAAQLLLKRPQVGEGYRIEQLDYVLVERESVGPAP